MYVYYKCPFFQSHLGNHHNGLLSLCHHVNIPKLIINISAMLSALKVIKEVMKLINNFEVHTYVYYHNTYNMSIIIY